MAKTNWSDILREVKETEQGLAVGAQTLAAQSRSAADTVRRRYLAELAAYTTRNVIAYYSGFLQKPVQGMEINDEDKNGFMVSIHKMDRAKGLDLILHTPGGSIAATQSIVYYLRSMFGSNIRAIVPQMAMSGGTMIACSCKKILMGKHSSLGPIDPQLSNLPAHGVLREFRRACREIKRDPSRIPIWASIIQQYRPTFLSQCENAIKWSNDFVMEELRTVMFEGVPDADDRAKRAVKSLSDFSRNKSHDRHIHLEDAGPLG
jgi:ATP-dependent protease ClpP protease subunit